MVKKCRIGGDLEKRHGPGLVSDTIQYSRHAHQTPRRITICDFLHRANETSFPLWSIFQSMRGTSCVRCQRRTCTPSHFQQSTHSCKTHISRAAECKPQLRRAQHVGTTHACNRAMVTFGSFASPLTSRGLADELTHELTRRRRLARPEQPREAIGGEADRAGRIERCNETIHHRVAAVAQHGRV